MPKPFIISLGGIPIELKADRLSGKFDFVKKTALFQSCEQPQLTIQVNCGWFPEDPSGTPWFDTNISWKLFKDDNHWVYRVDTSLMAQLGIFPPDFLSGVIHVSARPYDKNLFVFPLAYPMGELFMMNLLASGLGFLAHATGVVYQGEGYLFAGHGGAGKSTTARLWQKHDGAQVLNDDKVIVRQENGQYFIYGTPWHGEGGMALPLSAPLKSIFILKQAPINEATPLTQTRAMSMLLARSFFPGWDAEKMGFTLQFLDELTRHLPCYELGFVPNPSVIDFVLNNS